MPLLHADLRRGKWPVAKFIDQKGHLAVPRRQAWPIRGGGREDDPQDSNTVALHSPFPEVLTRPELPKLSSSDSDLRWPFEGP